jgi:peptidoglycan/xylan/chitin deacetylase (PgdA/CDA1 family)
MTAKILTILVLSVVTQPLMVANAQATGEIEVFVKNENGDRALSDGLSIKVYKNLDNVAFREIALPSNPFTISSLELGEDYKIEVYRNSMYAGVGFSTLDKAKDSLEITIKNTGGMRLTVFYKDAETPLSGAKIKIKSFDGKPWGYSETDGNGQTVRFWLHPTVKDGEFYSAEIALSSDIKYTYSPIRLSPGVAQEFKVVTKWPTLIDKMITVEVYNDTKNKVSKYDGAFIAQLFDSNKTKVAESQVTDKGVAHFSKLRVGTYALNIVEKGQNASVAKEKVTIAEEANKFRIYLNNPELNSDYPNCNCVAFRLDDIQDFFLAQAQMEIISLFEKKKTPLTIGVIGGVIGTDAKLVNLIKGDLASKTPVLEVASHSWNNRVLPTMTKAEQEDIIKKTNNKINEVFGKTPTTFIPPENLFTNDTITILKENGFTHISYAVTTADPIPFKGATFYHFPMAAYTASLSETSFEWVHTPNKKILTQIHDSLFERGYAVVMMHPYEFSEYVEGFYTNKANMTKIAELDSLIEQIKSENLKILPIGSIQDFEKPADVIVEETQKPKPSCNCIAFRLDNIQDFWLNDVQNEIIQTFDQSKIPLTITIIGKFTGDDPKTVNTLKAVANKSGIKIANRGWEYIDHTGFDKERQKASIQQTNDKIAKVLGVRAALFSPPYDAFNKDTVAAAKEAKMAYFSSSMSKDPPPYSDVELQHVPGTLDFANLISDDPFFAGPIPQKATQKIRASIDQHGYAAISMQPADLAKKTEAYKNEIDREKLEYLKQVISSAKSDGIKLVLLERVPSLLAEGAIVVPSWIKNSAGWWADGQITDDDFTKGIQYLIAQKIIQIPSTSSSGESQKIPDWIKKSAGWWAEGQISDADFVKGIQYLIGHGIIRV